MPSWTQASARPAASIGRYGAAVLLGILLLAGCSPKPDVFAPACPDLRLLRDGADLTRFDGRGTDITDTIIAARLTTVPASCSAGPRTNTVKATMRVIFDLNRGPALAGRTVSVPYFVTILDGDQVLQEKDYVVPVTFPANVDKVTVTDDPIDLLFPITPQKSAATYVIYVSFRLTPAELAYNRSQEK